jgi:signal transduction histidine kinase
MQNELQFKISSAFKTIIGSDLINDDFIAVFELVKNAYDAHATQVEVIFENIYPKITLKDGIEVIENNAKIIIKDNGKGMNYTDLKNKWLFVAYSAKKEGTEEENYDYRDRIKIKRAYAGAKGIGRFSCDRLGRDLYLETIKEEANAKVEVLITDWEKFERDIKDEFIDISVLHETIDKSNYNVSHGTVLEITNLKSSWDRDKLLKLKSALAKLVNPNTKNSEDSFKINIVVDVEQDNDSRIRDNGSKRNLPYEAIYKDVVNGEIENFIFDTLDLKTTKILSEIANDVITTSLHEGGKLVYKIVEENILPNLKNIDFTIYFLNRSAKSTFSRRMGIAPVEYGHIFVYKNGLRIYPYGERGEDPLKMDNRKAQGQSRNLGTREVIGYIDIYGENDELRETSSRGDGLIKTQTYNELYQWFYTTLKRLEKYIIDVSDWGKDLSEDDYINLDEHDKVLALQNIVSRLSKSKNLKSIEYAPDLFETLEVKQEGSTRSILFDIKQKLKDNIFDKGDFLKDIEKAEKGISSLEKIKDNAEDDALEEFIKNEGLSNRLEVEKKKGAFQGALIGTDKKRIVGLQHQIYHSSSRVSTNVKLLLNHLNPELIDEKTKKYLKTISYEASKIKSISKFVTKANFNLEATEIETDIVDFIIEYLNEIYIFEDSTIKTDLKITIENKENITLVKEIRPLEITIIVDNLISNAEKANAKNLIFRFLHLKNKLQIEIIDDGKGISEDIIDNVFEFGFTTTSGSGIGLYQTRDLVINNMRGEISISSIIKKGTIVKIVL